MNKKPTSKLMKGIWILAIGGLLVGGGYYFLSGDTSETADTTSFYVVKAVQKGSVSSGIETTGEIVAAQKLDLDVYKQTSRIEAVNVINGGHVEEGQVLVSFDKSDAYVEVQSAKVRVAEAELALDEERTNYTDPNTTIRTLENDIKELTTAIAQAEKDKVQAYRDFLNADLSAEPGNSLTEDKTAPTISGLYTATREGEYRIKIYSSSADSGFSYQVSGLPGQTEGIIFNINTPLGTDGLKIKFASAANVQTNNEWIVAVPNVYAPSFIENKEDYEKAISDLDEAIASHQLDIENKQQQIDDLRLSDSVAYRNLNIAQAEASLSEAKVQLTQNYDVVQEQDIVAPFSGTIEGMENVVPGATPTRESNDSISLGTLISDEFLATFSLGAVDVAKVSVGQKVFVTITSFPNTPALEAAITEISSLPNSSGVAQYEVKALITPPEDLSIELREGLLADIEVVQQEVTDVVRVPSSAITYQQGKATVEVIDSLTETQQQMFNRLGIIRSDTGEIPSYPKEVSVGLVGTFYSEITNGLEEGTLIVISSDEADTSAAVQQQFLGPGSRERDTSTSQPTSQSSGQGAGVGRAVSGG